MEEENLKNINNSIQKHVSNIICALINEKAHVDSTNKFIKDVLINSYEESQEVNEVFRKLNAKYNDVKLTCDTMKVTLNERKNELRNYDVELNNLGRETNKLEKEHEKIEQNLIKTDKAMELSLEDKKIFELSCKKLELYQKMTNIKWDYSVPLSSTITRGYIVNDTTNYLNAFEFKKDSTCTEKLWKEIQLGSGEDWSDIVEMTKLNK